MSLRLLVNPVEIRRVLTYDSVRGIEVGLQQFAVLFVILDQYLSWLAKRRGLEPGI